MSHPLLDAPLPDWADPAKRPALPDEPLPDWATPKPSRLVSSPAEADYVMAVDVSNLAWRSASAHPTLTAPDGTPSGGVFGTVQEMLSKIEKIRQGRWCIAFCYDGRHAKAERRKILPCYKVKRKHDVESPIPTVTEALRGVTGLHIENEAMEGDDAIAWITGRCAGAVPVLVLSSDSDLWSLLSPEKAVGALSPKLGRYVRLSDVEEKYLCGPQGVLMSRAVHGDHNDVPGIPRLLKKKMAPYLVAGADTPERLYELLEAHSYAGFTAEAAAKLRDGRQQVERNFSVVSSRLDFTPRDVRVVAGDAAHLTAIRDRYGVSSVGDDRLARLAGAEFMATGHGYGPGWP